MTTTINVRIVQQRGRLRVRAQDGKFVQCSRDWRETQPMGLPLALPVTLRADGKCWVHQPQGLTT